MQRRETAAGGAVADIELIAIISAANRGQRYGEKHLLIVYEANCWRRIPCIESFELFRAPVLGIA